eukprot:sb/3461681/
MSWEKASFTWEAVRSTVKEMFSSSNSSGIPMSTVHFYGNDGVCVFKYLVTRDDPQWVFSTSILLVNFLCFIFILLNSILILVTKSPLLFHPLGHSRGGPTWGNFITKSWLTLQKCQYLVRLVGHCGFYIKYGDMGGLVLVVDYPSVEGIAKVRHVLACPQCKGNCVTNSWVLLSKGMLELYHHIPIYLLFVVFHDMLVFTTLLTGVIGLMSTGQSQLYSSSTTTPRDTTGPVYTGTVSPPDLDKCKLVEVGGYLHEQCFFNDARIYYKCPLSNSLYRPKVFSEGSNCNNIFFSKLCPSDPGFYQVCGHAGCIGYKELGGTPLLCGTYICNDYDDDNRAGDYWEPFLHCYHGACKNTNLNMVGCSSVVNTTCDGKCDADYCSDESYCNGVQYGLWCDTLSGWVYIPPWWICDGYPDCSKHGEDENEETGKTTLIQDNTRCFQPEWSACENRQDQTNCSDPERVTMQCLSKGFPTTISIWGYCQGYQLCDDNYNNVCVDPEHGCNIHKGQLCDGHPDCNNGGDETCKDLAKVPCIRRFHSPNGQNNVSLPIPLEWVMDGEVDCLDGKDEDETQWLKCGKDYYTRYQESGTECQEVLLCPLEKNYIDLNNLCDRINKCSFEEKLCNAARQTNVDVTNLIDTFITSQDQHFIQHCFPTGATDLERKLGKCNTVEHIAGFVKTVLNVQQPVLVSIPEKKFDCSHLYGANYFELWQTLPFQVQPRCSKLQKFPASTTIKYFRVITKDVSPIEMFVILKTTAGMAPINSCANHFKCTNYSELVVLSQVCDGVVNCRDFSDECSQSCPSTQNKDIFENNFLRSASLSMGVISTSLNTVSLIRSAWELPQQKTYEMFLNKAAIVLINLGDLMIGIYLLLLSYFDFVFNKNGKYCEERYQWFSSSECSFLGVLSTTGSQLSLFAMTMLSITRLANIGNLIQRDLNSYKSAARLVLLLALPLLASVLIAVTPILPFKRD